MPDEIQNQRDDYAPPSDPPNMTSYVQMGIAGNRWARTERSWVNIVTIFALVVLCMAANFGWK